MIAATVHTETRVIYGLTAGRGAALPEGFEAVEVLGRPDLARGEA